MQQYIQKHEYLKEAAKLAIQESTDLKNVAEDILTNVVIETIRKYQQKLNVGIQDSVSDLLDNFKNNISESIFNTVSNWRVANREYIIFPRGCRFCYTKGDNTIIVIEQEPQIRSLLFDSGILGNRYVYGTSNAERVGLALPYVVFIIHFKNNDFKAVYTGWKNSPLCDLDDRLFNPLLPNIHDNLSVCTGVIPNDLGNNIAQKCDTILSHFWNSKFNNDLSNFWWQKSNFDSRLKSARTWSDFSIQDSSFILRVTQGDQSEETKSVNGLIKLLTMHDYEPDEITLKHALSESIDKCVENLFSKITRYFRNTKFEKYHPKEVSDILKKIISEANSEISDMIFTINHELQKLQSQIDKSKVHQKIEPKGPLWGEYSN